MKNFFENLKDILYDSMDYVVMLAIVVGVVGIIGWRLDILFAKDAVTNNDMNTIVQESPSSLEDDKNHKVENHEEDIDSDSKVNDEDNEKDEITEDDETTDSLDQVVTVNIPNGSLPSRIGSILESNGLVENKNEFVQKAQDMNLDRALRSGSYEIDTNSSLEDIINIIARQR